jgi:phosphatidylinositol-bisphosphatase
MRPAVSGLPPLYQKESDGMNMTTAGNSQQNIRTADAWVERELTYYQDQYTQMQPLSCAFITFNVAERKPSELAFIVKNKAGEVDRPDMYCIGLQEVDMSAAAIMKEETESALPWITALRETIGADHEKSSEINEYYPLASKQLVGLLICVFVKKVYLNPNITHVAVGHIATGTLGGGNKGAVAVRFQFNWTSVCFINCHLAAHQEKVEKRNQDIDQILRDLGITVSPHPGAPVYFPRDHDVIVVVGDLNYRINLPYDQAVGLSKSNQVQALLKHDQLSLEMKDPHSPWSGFEDVTPTWVPTYRFDRGTSEYDTSEKKRIPAFTDRILFWAKDSRHRTYEVKEKHSVMSCMLSDHKPVRVLATLPMKTLDQSRQTTFREKLKATCLEKPLDQMLVARTAVNTDTLDFGECGYSSEVVREIEILNNGNCVSEVALLRQSTGDPSEGAWIRAEPLNFRLFPGERRTLTVYSRVDKWALQWLSSLPPSAAVAFKSAAGRFSLSSVLMILVKNGALGCVECKMSLQPSCFGSSIENLVRMGTVPCREAYKVMQPVVSPGGTSPAFEYQDPQPQIPKELWTHCDFLYHCAETPNLFAEEVDGDQLAAIRLHLDTSTEPLPSSSSPHAVAQSLVTFLKELQEPLIPRNMYFAALAAGRQGGKTPFSVLSSIPVLQCNVIVYTVSFFRYLLRPAYAARNGLTLEAIAPMLAHMFFQNETVPLGMDDGNKEASDSPTFMATPPNPQAPQTGQKDFHVDPATPAAPPRRVLDMRAELAQRKADSIAFLTCLLTEE